MTFYLLKNKTFQVGKEGVMQGNHCHRTITIPAVVEASNTGDESLSEKELAVLKDFLVNANEPKCLPEVSQQEKGEPTKTRIDWNLRITIAIEWNSYAKGRDFVVLTASGKENVLEKLKSFLHKHELKHKVTVHFHNLTFKQITSGSASARGTINSVVSTESDLDQLSSLTGSRLNYSGFWSTTSWHPKYNCIYHGAITIVCRLFPTKHQWNSVIFYNKPTVYRKILNEEINCDAVIIAKDDVSIKCHKGFLSAQSTKLQTMLNEDKYEESKTGTIHMSDMTEDGVKAFLEYLYLRDSYKADNSCGVAIELLEAGHKYGISSLEAEMKAILLSKPDDWYQVDQLMKLFLFARNLPQGEELKMKAINLLKKNSATLKSSPTYKELFKDDAAAAMELCEYAFSI